MIKHLLNSSLLLFALHFMCISCTEEVDFNQINDLEINPITTASLFYFNATAGDFIVGGNNQFSAGDFVQIDIFNNQFINDNLIKAELEFETVNSINRAYQVQVDFFDNANQLRHTFMFTAEASANNEDLTGQHIETFEGVTLSNLKRTTRLDFTLTMLPGTPINSGSPGRIQLKSKGTFFLNIKR